MSEDKAAEQVVKDIHDPDRVRHEHRPVARCFDAGETFKVSLERRCAAGSAYGINACETIEVMQLTGP
jgi:hypothetical protein